MTRRTMTAILVAICAALALGLIVEELAIGRGYTQWGTPVQQAGDSQPQHR